MMQVPTWQLLQYVSWLIHPQADGTQLEAVALSIIYTGSQLMPMHLLLQLLALLLQDLLIVLLLLLLLTWLPWLLLKLP